MLPFDIPLLLITEGLISTICEQLFRAEMCNQGIGKHKSIFSGIFLMGWQKEG